MNKDEEENYIWESGYDKAWEAIKEDEDRLADNTVQDLINNGIRRQRVKDSRPRSLCIMRSTFIVLDISQSMTYQDFKPLRIKFVVDMLNKFVDKFFRTNVIAQIGVITTADGWANLLCKLSFNSINFKSELIALADRITNKQKMCGSTPSLQNAALLAMQYLQYVPVHSCRDIIFIMGSLATIDSGNINETISELKSKNIKCSVISLSAEVFIHKQIANETEGHHIVALNEDHFYQQLIRLCDPELPSNQCPTLVPIAFPRKLPMEERMLCMQSDHSSSQCNATYICPRCQSAYCSLPTVCSICSLTLASGTEFMRSIHYLYPLKSFEDYDSSNLTEENKTGSMVEHGKVVKESKIGDEEMDDQILNSEMEQKQVEDQCGEKSEQDNEDKFIDVEVVEQTKVVEEPKIGDEEIDDQILNSKMEQENVENQCGEKSEQDNEEKFIDVEVLEETKVVEEPKTGDEEMDDQFLNSEMEQEKVENQCVEKSEQDKVDKFIDVEVLEETKVAEEPKTGDEEIDDQFLNSKMEQEKVENQCGEKSEQDNVDKFIDVEVVEETKVVEEPKTGDEEIDDQFLNSEMEHQYIYKSEQDYEENKFIDVETVRMMMKGLNSSADSDEFVRDDICDGCLQTFEENTNKNRLRCPKCKQIYCSRCEMLLHTLIFSCPGCCENKVKRAVVKNTCRVLKRIIKKIVLQEGDEIRENLSKEKSNDLMESNENDSSDESHNNLSVETLEKSLNEIIQKKYKIHEETSKQTLEEILDKITHDTFNETIEKYLRKDFNEIDEEAAITDICGKVSDTNYENIVVKAHDINTENDNEKTLEKLLTLDKLIGSSTCEIKKMIRENILKEIRGRLVAKLSGKIAREAAEKAVNDLPCKFPEDLSDESMDGNSEDAPDLAVEETQRKMKDEIGDNTIRTSNKTSECSDESMEEMIIPKEASDCFLGTTQEHKLFQESSSVITEITQENLPEGNITNIWKIHLNDSTVKTTEKTLDGILEGFIKDTTRNILDKIFDQVIVESRKAQLYRLLEETYAEMVKITLKNRSAETAEKTTMEILGISEGESILEIMESTFKMFNKEICDIIVVEETLEQIVNTISKMTIEEDICTLKERLAKTIDDNTTFSYNADEYSVEIANKPPELITSKDSSNESAPNILSKMLLETSFQIAEETHEEKSEEPCDISMESSCEEFPKEEP
ncbi:hypothetical protein GJ496_001947 [Pomphorhynchus laevis]|nr:hypothetical protein GJ496_001947 [Pomphorhynchus laevis]